MRNHNPPTLVEAMNPTMPPVYRGLLNALALTVLAGVVGLWALQTLTIPTASPPPAVLQR